MPRLFAVEIVASTIVYVLAEDYMQAMRVAADNAEDAMDDVGADVYLSREIRSRSDASEYDMDDEPYTGKGIEPTTLDEWFEAREAAEAEAGIVRPAPGQLSLGFGEGH